jgi:hypothetical protein
LTCLIDNSHNSRTAAHTNRIVLAQCQDAATHLRRLAGYRADTAPLVQCPSPGAAKAGRDAIPVLPTALDILEQ